MYAHIITLAANWISVATTQLPPDDRWQPVESINLKSTGLVELAFSPDNTRLLATYVGLKPVLFDVNSGNVIRMFEFGEATFRRAAFSPDGEYVLSTSLKNPETHIWITETGKLVRKLSGAFVCYLDDGKIIVTVTGPPLGRGPGPSFASYHYWHSESGRELPTFFDWEAYEKAKRNNLDDQPTPDKVGVFVPALDDKKRNIRIVEFNSGKMIKTIADIQHVTTRTKISPYDNEMSGRFEYSTGNVTIRKNDDVVARFGNSVNLFEFSPKEYVVATLYTADQSRQHEIGIRNALNGELIQTLNQDGPHRLVDISWSPDGQTIAAADFGGNIYIYAKQHR